MDETTMPVDKSPISALEPLVMPIVSAIPLGQFKKWVSAYFHPAQVFESQRSSINSNKLGLELVLMSLLPIIITLVNLFIKLPSPNAILGSLLVIVISILSFVLSFVVSALLLFVIAKILGGKAGYYEHSYSIALLLGAFYVLTFPFYLLSLVPLVGAVLSIVIALIGLYNVYNFFLMMKYVHQLSSIRAALLALIPIIIMVALFGTLIMAVIGLSAIK